MTNLTWWDPVLPNGPQFEPAITWEQLQGSPFAWNYTHVFIAAGGFYWKPVAGWNLVSVPKNISATWLVAGQFMASRATLAVSEAAIGAGIPVTEIILGSYIAGTVPAVYDIYDFALGGPVDFPLTIDYSYWLWVDVDMSAEGVYMQCEGPPSNPNGELDLGWGEIDAAGINQVTLNAGWTFVNPSASWTNGTAWLGGTGLHVDSRGNNASWSMGTEVLFTGGGWIDVGAGQWSWYSVSGIVPTAPYLGQGDNPGTWTDNANVVLQDAACWYPSNDILVDGTYTMNAYPLFFLGVQDFGQGSCNDAQQLFYAGGFLVYSVGGGVLEYDVNYDYLAPLAAPPYTP
jgi:hypothetical protein